jgi:hypothetical protein
LVRIKAVAEPRAVGWRRADKNVFNHLSKKQDPMFSYHKDPSSCRRIAFTDLAWIANVVQLPS